MARPDFYVDKINALKLFLYNGKENGWWEEKVGRGLTHPMLPKY
jgi:hypothetical protein